MIAMLALAIAALLLCILTIVVWNVLAWPAVTTERRREDGAVSVLVPARDEAANIGACLGRAAAQGPSIREILVYDDRSADGTAAIVANLSASDPRVRLLAGGELPAGWCGKNHACARLAAAASGSWLLFLDADARLEDGAVERLLAEALRRGVPVLSPWPALTMVTFWERVLMPMLNVLTFSLYPAPLSFLRDDPSLGLVHGACILVSSTAYQSSGGHDAVRNEILEDQRFAQLCRARGIRTLCFDGRALVSVRMYRSLRGIWYGFGKNFYPAFRSGATFWLFLSLHAAVFLVPLLLILATQRAAAIVALIALTVIRLLLALRFRHPLWSLLLHPIAEMILLCIAVASWWRCRSGRGVEWKGRRYHVSQAGERNA